MLPFILAGGAASVIAYFKPKCSRCKSRLTSNEKCFVCGGEVCGDCGTDVKGDVYYGWPILQKGRCCKTHNKDIEAKVTSLKAEIDVARQVTTYSKNFKGKTESPKLSKNIETSFHADKEVAELELQMLAAKEGCMFVLNVEFFKDTQSSGNYVYAVWKGKGVI
jgi:hypothetical protein